MAGLSKGEYALLISISDEVSRLRQDMQIVHRALGRMGALSNESLKPSEDAESWQPPVLKRLGDMVTIIADSNPEAAKALLAKGNDTGADPAADKRVDKNNDEADGDDKADGKDPSKKDNETNPRDRWWNFDDDPDPRDKDANVKDFANVADDVRDDDDGVGGEVKPDTGTDPDPGNIG